MKSNRYLYGDDVEVPDIPQEIIMRRVELLKENLDELLEVDYISRDGVRCTAIIRAIKFWEGLNGNEINRA